MSQFAKAATCVDHQMGLPLDSSLFGRGVVTIYRLTAPGRAVLANARRAACRLCRNDSSEASEHEGISNPPSWTRPAAASPLSTAATVAHIVANPGRGQPYSSHWGGRTGIQDGRHPSPKQRRYRLLICRIELWLASSISCPVLY